MIDYQHMKQTLFPINSLLKESWNIFVKHWKFIITAGLATIVVNLILQAIQNSVSYARGNFLISLLAIFLVVLAGIIIKIGWSRILLDLVRSSAANWNDFKSKPTLWLQFVKAHVWLWLYTMLLMIVTAIPGAVIATIGFFTAIDAILVTGVVIGSTGLVLSATYMGIRYQFLNFAVIDFPDLSSHAVFKKAGAITRGHLLQLLWLGVVLGAVNLLGLVVLLVGLAVTIPVTKLAQTKAYELCKSRLN
jgi:hypothetical protein